jgi:hypothetical protein
LVHTTSTARSTQLPVASRPPRRQSTTTVMRAYPTTGASSTPSVSAYPTTGASSTPSAPTPSLPTAPKRGGNLKGEVRTGGKPDATAAGTVLTHPRTPFCFRYDGLVGIYEADTKFKCDDPYYSASIYASRLMKHFEMSTEFYFLTVSEPSEPVNIFTYQLKENHLYVSCVIRANIATSNDQYDHLDLRPSVLNSIIKDLKIKVHGILTTDPTGPEIYRIKALWSYPRTGVASAPKLPSPCVCSTWNELKKRQTTSHGDPKEQQKKRILDKITSKQGEHDIISESVSSSTSTASDVAQLSIHKHKNKKEFKKKREKRLYYVLGKFPCATTWYSRTCCLCPFGSKEFFSCNLLVLLTAHYLSSS